MTAMTMMITTCRCWTQPMLQSLTCRQKKPGHRSAIIMIIISLIIIILIIITMIIMKIMMVGDCELKLDFHVLIPNQSKGESSMFMNFIEIGHNHLLKHPLCESFIYLKWLKVRKFFFVSLMFHLLFTVLHTTFVLLVYSSSQCIIRDNCKFKVDIIA